MLSEPSTLYHEDPIGICLPKTNRSSISVRLVLIPKIFGLPCARCFEDVNVGMIAEMRDAETMAAAVTAAEPATSFSTCIQTTLQTIDRIIDTFRVISKSDWLQL